ncbi:hypothetical protein CASFOL_035073 [Castilleja foliolosa]|uniref:Heat stress transcription factor n=1 Tax=Castilleja foliolosa TaxID=1961234 RepID=A0ABD3BST0_9LAMI
MDGAGGALGGPAPFLLKTYEMVDDASTDGIVSWSESKKSFVVWNPPEFQQVLLPTYFKHNNFSSFIRQLNTYGFRKVDPERWEFANEEFMKDQKHLLKNIHRRKPIHSHSQPQGSVDPERAAYEEEIDKLSREKKNLEANVSGFKDHQSAAKSHLETLTQRVISIELKQERLLSFLEKALQNPDFVQHLSQKLDKLDFSAYNKKRRLPRADQAHENISFDNQSNSRPELRLELSPAVSDVNLISLNSTQSSNEDGWNEVRVRTGGSELSSDAEASSFTLRTGPESPKLLSLHCNNSMATNNDEGDDNLSCLLNLSLASSTLELNSKSQTSIDGVENIEVGPPTQDRTSLGNDDGGGERNLLSSSRDAHSNKKQARVNDVFWEQFLTERPGCADTEEARPALTR